MRTLETNVHGRPTCFHKDEGREKEISFKRLVCLKQLHCKVLLYQIPNIDLKVPVILTLQLCAVDLHHSITKFYPVYLGKHSLSCFNSSSLLHPCRPM